MLHDARQVDAGSELDTDICIVGGGAAGITLARAFSGSPLRVTVLEAGGEAYDPVTNDAYKGRNVGLPYFTLDMCQLRFLGGNTNAWGGWCRPLDEIDFAPRPWVESSGWPIPRDELLPYYDMARDICQLKSDNFEVSRWIEHLGDERARVLPFDPAKIETAIYQFSPPTRFGEAYADDLRRSPNITCLLHANVVNIETRYDAREVTGLTVACLNGHRFHVRAKIYVLAAGGTENARLLLASRDVMPNGLGNQHDLVGRYFMEHPHTQRRIIPYTRQADVALYGLKFHDRHVSARLSLPVALQEAEGLLNYSANIHPVYLGHKTEGWMALRKFVLSLSRSRQRDPYLRFPPYGAKQVDAMDAFRILRELPAVTAAGFLQLLQPNRFIGGYILESKSEQAPNPDSRILLEHERDVFGVNRIKLDWKMLPIDRRTVVRAEEIVDAELQRLGIGELEPLPPELVEGWPDNLEGGWHQLGMTRMDPDPRRGVVDTDGRLHEVGNLFVTGGSVFPTVGAAPPTLTVVSMALRLADHLRAVLGRTDVDIGSTRTPAAAPTLAPAPARVLEPLEMPLHAPTAAARMG